MRAFQQILIVLLVLLVTVDATAQSNIDIDFKTQLHESDYKSIIIDGEEQHVYFVESSLAVNRGLLILLLNEDSSTYTAFSMQLAQRLSNWGYSSVIMHHDLPMNLESNTDNEETPQSPIQTELPVINAKSYQSEVKETHLQNCAKHFSSRYQSLVEQLQMPNDKQFLVSFGQLAACSLLSEEIQAESHILINPFIPEYTLNNALATRIASSQIPVLDLTSMQTNHWNTKSSKTRLTKAKQSLTLDYRQRQLLFSTLPDGANAVAKEIYAWLTYLGY